MVKSKSELILLPDEWEANKKEASSLEVLRRRQPAHLDWSVVNPEDDENFEARWKEKDKMNA